MFLKPLFPPYRARIVLGLFILLCLSQCKQSSILANNMPTRDENTALGNPDGAKASKSSPNAYLIARSTYSLSYNNSTGIAGT